MDAQPRITWVLSKKWLLGTPEISITDIVGVKILFCFGTVKFLDPFPNSAHSNETEKHCP